MTDSDDPLEDYDEETVVENALAARDDEALGSLKMTPKIAPAFDGSMPFYMYEEIVEEWTSLTTLDSRLWATNLRNRLQGEALFAKKLINVDLCKDPNNGVRYFLSELRPLFVKNAEHMFLWRFMKFFNKKRGSLDITLWIPTWTITFNYLNDSWADMAPTISDTNDQVYLQFITNENNRLAVEAQNNFRQRQQLFVNDPGNPMFADVQTGQPVQPVFVPHVPYDTNDRNTLEIYNRDIVRTAHRARFPLTDHLTALIFLVNTELTEAQLQQMNQFLEGRNIHMRNYTLAIVQEAYKTLFASVRTGIGNPMVRPRTSRTRGSKRSFYLFEAGEFDGEEGYWAEDEDTHQEGFLSTENDVFWTLDEEKNEWHEANVAQRRIKKRGKGSTKSKGKFKSKKRGRFRPHRSSKAHAATEDPAWPSEGPWDPYNVEAGYDTLFGKGKGWKSGKRKGKSKDDNKGSEAFKGWSKGYAKGKFKKGKFKSHVAQSGNDGENANQPAEGEASNTDWPTYTGEYYDTDTGVIWYTQGGGENAGQQWSGDGWSFVVQEIEERGKQMKNAHDVYLAGIGRWQKVDVFKHATYVILDSGCTRSMGSRQRVMAFVKACKAQGFKGWFTFVPCDTKFSFANSQASRCTERLIIHYPTNPSCSTEVDILEEGSVPILISIQQMRNLYMTFKHTPECDYITCEAFGLKDFPIPISTSNHLLLNLADLKTPPKRVDCQFLTQNVTQIRSAQEITETNVTLNVSQLDGRRTATDMDECNPPRSETHPAFAAGDEWEDDPYGGGGFEQPSSSVKKPEIIGIPDDILEDQEKNPPRVARRISQKSEDPVQAATLRRIHEKLRNEAELFKLHQKHYHMTVNAFKKRTSMLKIPKDIYELYEKVVKKCETCCKLKDGPPRSKVSGMRAEVFGDLLFIDHASVKYGEDDASKTEFHFMIVLDGATQFIYAVPVQTTNDHEAQEAVREYMHNFQVSPKKIVGDSAFQTPTWERFYNTHDITPISIGPFTPWPNRAEASVRVFKRHIYQLFSDFEKDPIRKAATFKMVLREGCWARNVSCTYGGKTPIELAFGRRPPDLVTLENAAPNQLTTQKLAPDELVNQVRIKALNSYIKARQAEDLRVDISSSLRFYGGPFNPDDKVWYYQVDKSKIKGGIKKGQWIRATVVNQVGSGSMVIIDLGTRIIKVNQSLLRKDFDPHRHTDVPLSGVPEIEHLPNTAEAEEVSSFAHSLWQSTTTGKTDVQELFAETARVSQCAAASGLRVGPPVDLRNGFDLGTRKGQAYAMNIILKQEPEVVYMSPVAGPWCTWSNSKTDEQRHYDRQKVLPMVRFCAQVAVHQMLKGRKFIIENPQHSSIWWTHALRYLMEKPGNELSHLSLKAFQNDKDVNNTYLSRPISLLHNFPKGALEPLWTQNNVRSRASAVQSIKPKCEQVYPYSYCIRLADLIRCHFNVNARDANTNLLADILELSLSDRELGALHSHMSEVLYTEFPATTQPNQISPQHSLVAATLTPMPVRHHHVHKLMVAVNTMSKGAETLLHLADYTSFTNQLFHLAGQLRQTFLPDMRFNKCSVLRGTLGATAPVLRAGDESYLFFWRKNDPPKWIYHLHVQLHVDLLEKFDPSQWSFVHFWKNSGVTPPPGLTPSLKVAPPTPDIPLRVIGQRPALELNTELPSGQQIHPPSAPSPDAAMPDAPRNLDLGGEGFPETNPAPTTNIKNETPATPKRKTAVKSKIKKKEPRTPEPKRERSKSRDPEPQQPRGSQDPKPKRERSKSRDSEPDKETKRNVKEEGFKPWNFEDPRKKKKEPQNDSEEELIPAKPEPVDQPVPDSDDEEIIPEEEYSKGFKRRHPPDQDDENWNKSPKKEEKDFDGLIIDHSLNFLTDEQRYAGDTGSFQICRDAEGQPVDIDKVETPQTVLRSLYSETHGSFFNQQPPWEPSELLGRATESDDELNLIQFCLKAQSAAKSKPQSTARIKKSKEATQTELRSYAKQFGEAKKKEIDSWVENEVYDLVDVRKLSYAERRNYVTGRWVLNIKRKGDGSFEKCKARWVLRGFQDKQKLDQQTDSPAASRPGFRMACQLASNEKWDLFHMDLKTAFLQGQKYDNTRSIICQLPPECDHPPYMVARMKKPAYGLNDAPRRWFNVVDASLRSYGCEPTRGDRCTYVMYSKTRTLSVPNTEATDKTSDIVTSPGTALDKLLDPFKGNNARGRRPCGIISLHVDDLFMAGDREFGERVLARLRQDYEVGSEDKNDVKFVGQRIRWVKDTATGQSHIEVSQQLAVDDLHEIVFEKSLKDNVACTPYLHTEYRSVLGMINWLQSRTQFQSCYKFSRAASQQASPIVADVRAVNKLVRMIKGSPVSLRFWPLKGACRIVGMPDASYRNNEDKSSQRALCIFLAEERRSDHVDTKGSLIDYESHKITQATMSTTVAELYALMKCFGNCLYLKGLWADCSGQQSAIHMRTDANNLVTTARTTHQPEQKETIHLIQMLRKESNSGAIDDLAHVVSADCLSDSLTKHSAKADALVKSVNTGILKGVDSHPPFRSLLKHKAFLAVWLCNNITICNPVEITCFMHEQVNADILVAFASNSHPY